MTRQLAELTSAVAALEKTDPNLPVPLPADSLLRHMVQPENPTADTIPAGKLKQALSTRGGVFNARELGLLQTAVKAAPEIHQTNQQLLAKEKELHTVIDELKKPLTPETATKVAARLEELVAGVNQLAAKRHALEGKTGAPPQLDIKQHIDELKAAAAGAGSAQAKATGTIQAMSLATDRVNKELAEYNTLQAKVEFKGCYCDAQWIDGQWTCWIKSRLTSLSARTAQSGPGGAKPDCGPLGGSGTCAWLYRLYHHECAFPSQLQPLVARRDEAWRAYQAAEGARQKAAADKTAADAEVTTANARLEKARAAIPVPRI